MHVKSAFLLNSDARPREWPFLYVAGTGPAHWLLDPWQPGEDPPHVEMVVYSVQCIHTPYCVRIVQSIRGGYAILPRRIRSVLPQRNHELLVSGGGSPSCLTERKSNLFVVGTRCTFLGATVSAQSAASEPEVSSGIAPMGMVRYRSW
jgi:hypothetical protein